MISWIKMPPACRESETVGETNISFVLSALHTDEKHSPTMGFPLPNARREGRPQLTRNRGMCRTPHCSNVGRNFAGRLVSHSSLVMCCAPASRLALSSAAPRKYCDWAEPILPFERSVFFESCFFLRLWQSAGARFAYILAQLRERNVGDLLRSR